MLAPPGFALQWRHALYSLSSLSVLVLSYLRLSCILSISLRCTLRLYSQPSPAPSPAFCCHLGSHCSSQQESLCLLPEHRWAPWYFAYLLLLWTWFIFVGLFVSPSNLIILLRILRFQSVTVDFLFWGVCCCCCCCLFLHHCKESSVEWRSSWLSEAWNWSSCSLIEQSAFF